LCKSSQHNRSNPASQQIGDLRDRIPVEKQAASANAKFILALLSRTTPYTTSLNRAQIGPTATYASVRSQVV